MTNSTDYIQNFLDKHSDPSEKPRAEAQVVTGVREVFKNLLLKEIGEHFHRFKQLAISESSFRSILREFFFFSAPSFNSEDTTDQIEEVATAFIMASARKTLDDLSKVFGGLGRWGEKLSMDIIKHRKFLIQAIQAEEAQLRAGTVQINPKRHAVNPVADSTQATEVA